MASPRAKRLITLAIILGAFIAYAMYRPMGRIAGPTRWDQESADGVRFLKEGRLNDAERCFTSALSRAQSEGDTGTSLQDLGDLRSAQSRFEEAEDYYSRALVALDADPRTPQQQIAVLLSSYSAVLMLHEKHAQAEPLLRRAISIREKTPDTNGPELRMNYLQLAAVRASLNASANPSSRPKAGTNR